MKEGYSPVEGGGVQRTDVYCHHCGKTFIAHLDFSLTGNHVVRCPRCDHEHFRVIEHGKITEDRWSSKFGSAPVIEGRTSTAWTSEDGQMRTQTTSHFLRELWLNRSDL